MNQSILIGIAVVIVVVILYYGYKKYKGESFTPEQTNRANAIVMFINGQAAKKKSDYPAYARFLLNTKIFDLKISSVDTYYAMFDSAIKGYLSPTDVLMRMSN